jgi:hypothetical protein
MSLPDSVTEPPCPGEYVLHEYVSLPSSGYVRDVTYHLTIE